MSYKAQVLLTENSIKEVRSVLFIETFLLDKAKTDIERENKKANVDVSIELLDAENRIIRKVTNFSDI